jgi:lipopolysaccharide biosynthesis glycosyltransferase
MVPWLNGYSGKAIFCDCDFLFEHDIFDLVSQFDKNKAVQVVKHDYTPKEKVKFHGHVQHVYPRKNWSSMVMWNCGHRANSALNLDVINTKDPSFLHQFQWLDDDQIGEVSHEWNWLEGHYQEPEDGSPKAIHFTRGGPWFEGYENVQYADRWLATQKRLKEKNESSITGKFDQRYHGKLSRAINS